MFLIPPVPLSLVRSVLTLENPATNDSALPFLTPPHHSCPAVMLPKDDHNKEKKKGGVRSRQGIWRGEFMFKNSLSSPSGVDEPELDELLVWCLGCICLRRGIEGQALAGRQNSPLRSPQTRFIKIHRRTILRLSLHFLSKRGCLGHSSRSCLRGWRDAREGLTLGGHAAVEWNTWKELFRVTKESEAKLPLSPHPRSSLQPLQIIPRSWEDKATWIYRSGCKEERGRRCLRMTGERVGSTSWSSVLLRTQALELDVCPNSGCVTYELCDMSMHPLGIREMGHRPGRLPWGVAEIIYSCRWWVFAVIILTLRH